jgi:hypothetical protein
MTNCQFADVRNGENSAFEGVVGLGGGRGMDDWGTNGGSGGGSSYPVGLSWAGKSLQTAPAGYTTSKSWGNNGGTGVRVGGCNTPGGGGGAGAAGESKTSNNGGGDGGTGVRFTMTGAEMWLGGGGAGQGCSGGGLGGLGGGGDAGDSSKAGASGLPNTGGGAGAGQEGASCRGKTWSSCVHHGGNGGSGIVIIKHLTDPSSTAPTPPARTNCQAHLSAGETADGEYQINPSGSDAFSVWCDMTTKGGGWTMVLNRKTAEPDNVTGLRTVTKDTPSTCITDARWAALQAAGYSEVMAMDQNGLYVTTTKAKLEDEGACENAQQQAGYPPASLTRSPIAQYEQSNCHGSGSDHAHWFGITSYTPAGTLTQAQYYNGDWQGSAERVQNTRISSDFSKKHYFDRDSGEGKLWDDARASSGYATEAYMLMR